MLYLPFSLSQSVYEQTRFHKSYILVRKPQMGLKVDLITTICRALEGSQNDSLEMRFLANHNSTVP